MSWILFGCLIFAQQDLGATKPPTPLTFESNGGQLPEWIQFGAKIPHAYATFSEQTVDFWLQSNSQLNAQFDQLRMHFVNPGYGLSLEATMLLSTRAHFFRGQENGDWVQDVPQYEQLRYANAWPGIDLVFYESSGGLAFDAHLAPGADSGLIRFRFEGAQSRRINTGGELEIRTPKGSWIQKAPFLYQVIDGERVPVDGEWWIHENQDVGFRVGDYDPSRALVIDPIVEYSSFLGGTQRDEIHGMAVDDLGAIYVTGLTASPDFPRRNSYQGTLSGLYDVFVSKFDASLSQLIYSTYLGGGGGNGFFERGIAVDVDGSGSVVVTGRTNSATFPTVNAFQPNLAGEADAFVAKLSADGSSLIYSTYLGGRSHENDSGFDVEVFRTGDVVVDSSGSAWVVGATASDDFPLVNAYQDHLAGSFDVFVSRLDATGSVVFSTYLGGPNDDMAWSIERSQSNALFISGRGGLDFPTTPNVYRDSGDGFVVRMTDDGQNLVASTKTPDIVRAMAVDSLDSIYVTGTTRDFFYPTTFGSNQTFHSGSFDNHPFEMYVMKIRSNLSEVDYSTLYGSRRSDEVGNGIAVNAFGEAIVGGTWSSHVATPTSLGLFVKFNADGSALVEGEVFGEDHTSFFDIVTAPNGFAYASGRTTSPSYPTHPGAFQGIFGGATDGVITAFSDPASSLSALTANAQRVLHGTTVQGRVTLDGMAPAGGIVVSLQSDHPAIVSVPPTVSVPAGASSVTFPITTSTVTTQTPVRILAFYSGSISLDLLVWFGPRFTVEDLEFVDDPQGGSVEDINEAADACGHTNDTLPHQSRWPLEGPRLEIGIGTASGINNLGQVTGNDGLQAIRYTDGIGLESLGFLPGGGFSTGTAVNDFGQVVGWSDSGTSIFQHAMRHTDGIGMEDLGTLGGRQSEAEDINNLGVIVGHSLMSGNSVLRAFRYTDSTGMQDLGTLPGDMHSGAFGVNELGQITGGSSPTSTSLGDGGAFLYADGSGMVDLGALPGDSGAIGHDVNNNGDVVGVSFDPNSSSTRAFLYTQTRGMQDLREWISDEDAFAWRSLDKATAINDRGLIVGTGQRGPGYGDTAGFRLRPCGARTSNYGTGWPGTLGVPALTASAPPVVCESFELQIGNSVGQTAAAILLIGFESTTIVTPAGGTLLVLPSLSLQLQVPAGGLNLPSATPCDIDLCGFEIFLQEFMLDPGAAGGVAFSQGLALTIGNR